MGRIDQALRIEGPLALKRILYGRRGEPYHIGDHRLRFLPGTRPIRDRPEYYASANLVNRYDAWQLRYLSDHLKPGHSAIDIGAHHGQDSLVMSALCGREGSVVAFEPSAEARDILMQNLALNPHVKPPTVVPFAVSDQDGQATLFAEAGASANSSLASTGTSPGGTAQCQVRTVKLDTWMTSVPDLVKIDVEGYEIRILAGARRLLESPARILCELHPYAWPELGDSYDALRNLLAEHGRRVRYLDDHDPMDLQYGIVLLERR